ncbi:ABC transporter substrate-binding protein SapA [Serratia microhaemolytica]|uniref:ABC transporter substrate-binding protein SapA n=1 Tax=Serratia microhaemolytica TaxID=2675110 RepID=UPI000FDD8006|nr:ABC transporter substrate-binding protein SapA [Serratia microhaemolytica]
MRIFWLWFISFGCLANSFICLAGSLSASIRPTSYTPATYHSPTDIRRSGFVYCVNGILNTFNPQMASSGLVVDTLSAQLYDRLLTVDPNTYRLLPGLAERWVVLDNGATYRFHLRNNVPFQTTAWFQPTRNMNAEDVLFSFRRIFQVNHPFHALNGGEYPYFDSLQLANSIQSINKLDDYTVEFRLRAPNASFLWHLATHYAPILSAEYATKLAQAGVPQLLDRKPVGTGPFLLSEYHARQYLRLARHDSYWQGKPQMPQVVIDMSAGGAGRLAKLLTGECDVLAYPAASQISVLRKDPRLSLTLRPGMNVAYLAFNTAKPPLDNLKVRQAIALAIDSEHLMQSIYYGSAETASSILPRASWAYDSEAKPEKYDLAQARQLLKQAGITHLSLTLWVPIASQSYNPSPMKMAELLQASLAPLGITLSIVPVDGHYRQERLMEMHHDLTLTGWATDSNDPDSFFRPLLSCAAIRSQTNYAHWCNPGFDDILQNAQLTSELSQRISYYRQAQKILTEQLPILPLASSLHLQAYRHDINGLIFSPFGNASFAGVHRTPLKEEQTK